MAMPTYLNQVPEFVSDSRLEVNFETQGQDHFTIHPKPWSRRHGATHDRWLHKEVLGAGGFGSVELQAEESGGTTRYRAVKTIRFWEGNKEHCKLIARELEALFKFSHPKYSELFVQSYGWFVSNSQIHIAMEYYDFGDLERYIRDPSKCPNHRLPEQDVLAIASQTLDALHMMHNAGFSHRDLKPANIMIKTHPPMPWWIKLGDFGISKRGREVTEFSQVRGTPGFIPPELHCGTVSTEATDHAYAIDMWCLGEIAYRSLTGQATFDKIQLYKFSEGRMQFPESILSGVGASSNATRFIKSAMMADPTKRLSSKEALQHPWMTETFQCERKPEDSKSVTQTNNIQMDEATAAWPTTLISPSTHSTSNPATSIRGTKIMESTNTNEATAVWPTAILLGADPSADQVATIQGANTVGPTGSDQPPTSRRPPTAADTKPAVLSNAAGPDLLQHSDNTLLDVPDTVFSTTGNPSPGSLQKSVVETREMVVKGDDLFQKGSYSEAELLYQQVYDTRKEALGLDHEDTKEIITKLEVLYGRIQISQAVNMPEDSNPELSISLFNYGRILFDGGQFQQSGRFFKKALSGLTKHFGETDRRVARSIYNLGYICLSQGDPAEAAKCFQKSFEICRAKLGEKHPDTFLALRARGYSLKYLGRYEEAKPLLQQVNVLAKEILGEKHPVTWRTMGDLSQTHDNLGEYEESKIILEKLIQLQKEAVGEEAPQVLDAMNCLGLVYFFAQDFEKAKGIFEKTLILQQITFGEKDLRTLATLAMTLLELNKLEEAGSNYEILLSLQKEAFGEIDANVASTLHMIGFVQYRLGNLSEAKSFYEQSLSLRQSLFGKADKRSLATMGNLAGTLTDMNLLYDAQTIYMELLRFQIQKFGKKDLSVAHTQYAIGVVCYRQCHFVASKVYCEEALETQKMRVGEEHPSTISTMESLAKTLHQLMEFPSAELILRKLVAIKKKIHGEEDQRTLDMMHSLGAALYEQTKFKDAEAIYRQAVMLRRKAAGNEGGIQTRGNWAESLVELGRLREAELVYDEIYQERRRLLGEGHEDTFFSKEKLRGIRDYLRKSSWQGRFDWR